MFPTVINCTDNKKRKASFHCSSTSTNFFCCQPRLWEASTTSSLPVACSLLKYHNLGLYNTISMDRPRRSTRQPVKAPQLVRPEPPRVAKRKSAAEVDPEKMLKTLLESSKSDLVSLDMNVRMCFALERIIFGLFSCNRLDLRITGNSMQEFTRISSITTLGLYFLRTPKLS